MAAFQFLAARGNILVRGDQFPHAHEGVNDQNAHVYGPLAIQDRGKHDDAVFREGMREMTAPAAALV